MDETDVRAITKRNCCQDCGKDVTGEAELILDQIFCRKCLKTRKTFIENLKLPSDHPYWEAYLYYRQGGQDVNL